MRSTYPCPIAVHMEPFSTSVFKRLFHSGLRPKLHNLASTPSYSSELRIAHWPGISRALKRHPFSGLIHSAVWHFNPAFGSSRIASSAYQKWPTWSSHYMAGVQLNSLTPYLFKV
ncbi:unnamed protein product [Bathycoccus prasinos]